jgi:enoyl-CoA hydratase/carnithine racemase
MTRTFDEYQHAYRHVAMTRTDGILELRLHSDDGPLVWGDSPHRELGRCFWEVGADPANRVIILTGTGDEFIARLDDSWVGAMTPQTWNRIFTNGKRLLQALLDIEVPVIGAVNGKATVHAELALLSDIVIASERAVFQDAPHFRYGTVPGDGVHIVWPHLLGLNRGRYFVLTGQRIHAHQALELGVVSEVVPADALRDRAWTLARDLCRQPDTVLRYTREALIAPVRRLVRDDLTTGLALEGPAFRELAHRPRPVRLRCRELSTSPSGPTKREADRPFEHLAHLDALGEQCRAMGVDAARSATANDRCSMRRPRGGRPRPASRSASPRQRGGWRRPT